MSEKISGQIIPIKSGYVDSDNPNVLYTNVELLKLKMDKTECYVIFSEEEIASIPCYAQLNLYLYAHYDINSYTSRTILRNLYKLTSKFTDSSTYNNKPSQVLIKDISGDNVNTYFNISLPESIDNYKYGFGFEGYCYVTWEEGYIRSELCESGRPYLKYTYTKDAVELTVTGTSVDNDISTSWLIEDTDVLTGTIKAYQNGYLVNSKSITNTGSTAFPPGTFTTTDDITFILELYKKGALYTGTVVASGLTNTKPTISNLEPSNVSKLRTNPIDVTFSGANISGWSLAISQNGITKHTDSGTTSRSSTIQANVLNNGQASISLTVWYNGAGYTTYSSQAVTFTVYGKPSQPAFSVQASYNTPKPLFSWSNNSEQVAWKFIIETSTGTEVINTGELYGPANSYQPEVSLLNSTYYTAKISIKNQYDIWSDAVSGTFLIAFATLSPPVFTLYADEESAMNVLVIESVEDASFSKHTVHRRESGSAEWLQIADDVARIQTVRDCECGAGISYEYKVTAVSDIEAYTDSEIKSITCNFHNTHISVANTDDKVVLNMEVNSEVSYVDDITFEIYDGQDKPDSSGSGLGYATLTVSAEVDTVVYNKLMMYWKEPLLCLRDRSGILLYGRITQPHTNFKCYGLYNIDFTFTECYNEGVNMNASDEYGYCYFIERQW